MVNKARSELAISILNYQTENTRERLILLRDAEGILDGSFRDVDIFTKKFDREKFISYLLNNDFSVVKIVQRHEFYQFAVVHSSNDAVILLDIWTTLHYRGIPYYENFSPDSVRCQNLFYALGPEQSLAIACIKCQTQTGQIKPKYLAKLDEMGICINELTERSLLHVSTVDRYSFLMLRTLWLYRFVKYLFSRKLLVIYLLGPDGAGKTTISDKLLNSDLRAKKWYFHGRIPVLPRIQKITRSKPRKVQFSDQKKKKFTVFHAVYYILDGLLSRVMVNTMFWQDKLILCDRTHYDIIARETYRNVPHLVQRSLIRSLIKPDHCFLLYCDAIEINRRKPELPVEEIQSQYRAYRKNINLLDFREVSTSTNARSITLIAREISDDLHRNR